MSCPGEMGPAQARLLTLMADLFDRGGRSRAALTLAHHLGADAVLIFIRDPEVDALIPALGFPQTLPRGRELRDLVERCVRDGHHQARVAFPDQHTHVPALGCRAADGSVLVLLGGAPRLAAALDASLCLPLVTFTLRMERSTLHAQKDATGAQQAAEQARTLAARLDTTRRELQHALFVVETAYQRLAFQAKAATVLGSSLEYEATLTRVAQLAVPFLSDWCVADIVEDAGVLRRLAVAQMDPQQHELAAALAGRFDRSREAAFGIWRVIRSGRTEVCNEISDTDLLGLAGRPEHVVVMRRLGLRSYMCAPMVARGRTLGTLLFLAAEPGRRFTDADVALAEDLATRAALAVDNAQLYRNAKEALRIRNDFLSIAAHELRTPITPIQLQLQGLLRIMQKESIDGQLLSRYSSRLGVAISQADRLAKLVNNLLDVSRLSAGRLDLEIEDVDLSAVVEEVASRFAEEIQRVGCTLEVRTPGPVMGRWDRLRLEQVVSNHLSNATKYGCGKLIEMDVDATTETARLRVRDYGIGISPKDQSRIFERFERAVPARNYAGLGLGLWIVRQIVEALDGTIAVTSEPGAGAVFTVELPRGQLACPQDDEVVTPAVAAPGQVYERHGQ